MATRTYTVAFRTTDTALTLTVASFKRASDGQALTPQPSGFTNLGYGLYSFAYDIDRGDLSHTVAHNNHAILVLDGGVGITDPEVRYCRLTLATDDKALDYPISVVQTAVSGVQTDVDALQSAVTALQTTVDDSHALTWRVDMLMEGKLHIDSDTNQTTIYKPDGTTPIQTWDLEDANGDPAVQNVMLRDPTLTLPSEP